MMEKMFSVLAIILSLSVGPANGQQQTITVAVSANMQYAIKELKNDFETSDHIRMVIVIGASGNLMHQILQGAPYDVFISADTMYAHNIFQHHFAEEKPKVYARGVLVLWTTKTGLKPQGNLQFLLSSKIKHIAIANPDMAPYGRAAVAILKKYHLLDRLRNKLVYGESVTQTSQFIATQNADIGFTAKSIVISDQMKHKGEWIELNSGDYPAILQSAVLLKNRRKNNSFAAQKFYQFLFSAKAKDIYKKYGYIN